MRISACAGTGLPMPSPLHGTGFFMPGAGFPGRPRAGRVSGSVHGQTTSTEGHAAGIMGQCWRQPRRSPRMAVQHCFRVPLRFPGCRASRLAPAAGDPGHIGRRQASACSGNLGAAADRAPWQAADAHAADRAASRPVRGFRAAARRARGCGLRAAAGRRRRPAPAGRSPLRRGCVRPPPARSLPSVRCAIPNRAP